MSIKITLSPPERRVLMKMSRSRTSKLEEVRRSRILLGLASGKGLREVSREDAAALTPCKLWRDRFRAERLGGLYSRHRGRRPGRGTEQLEARIINWTLNRKPSAGATHWSSRKLAQALGTDHVRIARVWAKAGWQPHRRRHYLSRDDPDFERKAAEVIALYLKPPIHAVVFCVDMRRRPFKPSTGSIRSCLSLPEGPSGMVLNTFAMAPSHSTRPSTPPAAKCWARPRPATPVPSSSLSSKT